MYTQNFDNKIKQKNRFHNIPNQGEEEKSTEYWNANSVCKFFNACFTVIKKWI